MLHISEKKIIDYDNYLSLAKSLGIHIHENLFINKIEDNNYGVFTKGEIDNKDKIISVPKKFLISQSIIKDFILEKKIEYPNLDFLKLYFSSVPDLEYFKNNHIAFADNNQKNNILNLFICSEIFCFTFVGSTCKSSFFNPSSIASICVSYKRIRFSMI